MSVSNQIIEVINALCEKFGIVIDWTSNNVMPYIESIVPKIVNYEIMTSLLYILLSLFITVVLTIVSALLYAKMKKEEWDVCYDIMGALTVAIIIVTIISAAVFLGILGGETYDIIVAKTFPEKTVIEFIDSLMRSTTS